MIKNKSFKHGWFYHYRVHLDKVDSCGYSGLKNYLNDMFENCPDEHFSHGPRGSALKFKLNTDVHELDGHEICEWAEKGLEWEHYKTAHSNVQVFMLQNDDKTLAVEVPLWIQPDELDLFHKYFEEDGPLTGHIDALRIEDGKIWIWDFKPKAHKEKYANVQVYFYALMLAKRTGISLDNFRCGYFDQFKAYVFKPEMKHLEA